MKQLIFTFLLSIGVFTFSNGMIIENFENLPGGTTDLIGVVFQSTGGAAVDLVDNPNIGGINTSSKVARLKVYSGAATSGIIRLCLNTGCSPNYGFPALPDGKTIDRFRFKYYKGNLSDRAVLLEPWGASTNTTLKAASGVDTWEYIEFEMTPSNFNNSANNYNIQIKVNRKTDNSGPAPINEGQYIYVDDFEFYNYETGPVTALKLNKEYINFEYTQVDNNTYTLQSFINNLSNVKIDLISMDGSVTTLYNQKTSGILSLSIQVQNKGIYFIRMTADNKNTKTIKFINY